MACGIFLDQGSNPCSLQWKHGVLTTGPPVKSSFFQNKTKLMLPSDKEKNLTCLLGDIFYSFQEPRIFCETLLSRVWIMETMGVTPLHFPILNTVLNLLFAHSTGLSEAKAHLWLWGVGVLGAWNHSQLSVKLSRVVAECSTSGNRLPG